MLLGGGESMRRTPARGAGAGGGATSSAVTGMAAVNALGMMQARAVTSIGESWLHRLRISQPRSAAPSPPWHDRVELALDGGRFAHRQE